jgi:hypothetical protein
VWGWDIKLVKAVAVPGIAFLVWLTIREVKAGLTSDDEDKVAD